MSRYREDDNSQQWFDATVRQRMQQRAVQRNPNTNSKSYLDQKVNTHPTNQPQEITDPYIKSLVESRQQQQFYTPAHLGNVGLDRSRGGDYEVSVDMDMLQASIQRKQQEFMQQSDMQNVGVSEDTISRLLHNQPNPQPQQFMPGFQQSQQQTGTITLREGYPVYRQIHTDGTVKLAREVGSINSQLTSQQFIMKGPVNVFVVPQNQTTVNLQELQNNPAVFTQLVEIQSPPMSSLGNLYVPSEAINGMNQMGGRQLITDSRQYQYQPQPRYQPAPQPQQSQQKSYGFPVKRGILKG